MRSRSRLLRRGPWAALALSLALQTPVLAVDSASTATVNHAFPDRADTPLYFNQQGTLLSINDDAAPGTLTSPAATNIESNLAEKHWRFDINHQATSLAGTSVVDFTAWIQGTHITAPHLGEVTSDVLPIAVGDCTPGSTSCLSPAYSDPNPVRTSSARRAPTTRTMRASTSIPTH